MYNDLSVVVREFQYYGRMVYKEVFIEELQELVNQNNMKSELDVFKISWNLIEIIVSGLTRR